MSTGTTTRPLTDLATLFVPVIFANGQDDDTPGLVALFSNEAVQFDERVYQPGGLIKIAHRAIVMTRNILIRIAPPGHSLAIGIYGHRPPPALDETWIEIDGSRLITPWREVMIDYCNFDVSRIPGPKP